MGRTIVKVGSKRKSERDIRKERMERVHKSGGDQGREGINLKLGRFASVYSLSFTTKASSYMKNIYDFTYFF